MKKPLVCIFLFVMIVNIPLSAQDVTPGNHTHNFDTYWKDFKSTPAGLFSLERYESWEIFGYAGLATLFYVSTDMEMHEEFGLERLKNTLMNNKSANAQQILDALLKAINKHTGKSPTMRNSGVIL